MTAEATLLERFRRDGDAASMEEFVRATRSRLLAVARRIGAPQDAEDSVQAAYHALLRRADLPPGVNPTAWLVTATVRIAYRRKATTRLQEDLARRLTRERLDDRTADGAIRREEDALLRAAVHRLPARYRDAVVLHHLEGLPLADVARLLDVPEATAKTRVQRGRSLLRWRLGPVFAHAVMAVPWAASDVLRAAFDPQVLVTGGIMKSKIAVGALVVVAFGLGTAVGVSLTAHRIDDADPPPTQSADANPPSATPAPPRAEPAESAPRGERPRRADSAPAFSLDDVRRVVAEELARRAATGDEAPPPPPPANATLNADPAQREAVRKALGDVRRNVIECDLTGVKFFDFASPPDPARMKQYPDPNVWLEPSSRIEHSADRYEVIAADGKGFDGTRKSGAFAFTAPLAAPIAASEGMSLLFLDGIADDGVVTMQNSATIHVKGDLRGKLFLKGGTLIVDGNASGEIEAKDYVVMRVGGAFTGKLVTKSYFTGYLMGGFSGTMDLYDCAALYFAGYTPTSTLARIKSMDRSYFTLEGSDLPPGRHKGGEKRVEINVVGPK